MSELLVIVYAIVLLIFCGYFFYRSIFEREMIIIPIALAILSSAILLVLFGESFPISLFQLILLLFFLQSLSHIFLKQDELLFFGYFKLIIPFLLLIAISLFYSDGIEGGLVNFFRMTVLMWFVFLFTQLSLSISHFQKTFIFVVGFALMISGISVIENILNPQIAIQNVLSSGIKIDRASAGGIFTDPNRFAAALFLPMIYSFIKLLGGDSKREKLLFTVVFALLAIGLVSSYSRSAFFALVVALIFVAIYLKKIRQLVAFSFIGILLVGLIPSIRDSFAIYLVRILDLIAGNMDTSSSIRIMLGKGALIMFADSNMLGVGFGGFSENITQYLSTQQTVGVVEPHNVLYTILAELGIIGLFMFCLIIYKAFSDGLFVVIHTKGEFFNYALTLYATLISYFIFYQFYDGALYDANIYLIISLILILKFKIEENSQDNLKTVLE